MRRAQIGRRRGRHAQFSILLHSSIATPDSTVPRLSSLVDDLLSEDSPPFHPLYADDQAVLVFDSTEVVQPAPVGSTDRRAFLARASILTLAIPGVGAALVACSAAIDTLMVADERAEVEATLMPASFTQSQFNASVVGGERVEMASRTATAGLGVRRAPAPIAVKPPGPLRPAHDFVIAQREWRPYVVANRE